MISSDLPGFLSASSASCRCLRFLRERAVINGEMWVCPRDTQILTQLVRKLSVFNFPCVEELLELLLVQLRSVKHSFSLSSWHGGGSGQGEASREKRGGHLIKHWTALTSWTRNLLGRTPPYSPSCPRARAHPRMASKAPKCVCGCDSTSPATLARHRRRWLESPGQKASKFTLGMAKLSS